MNEPKVDIHEGTITFWIKKGQIHYDDGKPVIFMNIDLDDGSIVLSKNTRNSFEFVHIVNRIGKSILEHDVSSLSSDRAHMFAVTWGLKSKELTLYIDGETVAKTQMKY